MSPENFGSTSGKPEVLTDRDVTRFLSKVIATEGCYSFRGAVRSGGYHQFWVNDRHRLAHRVAYTIAHGPIPPGLVVKHSCDNRGCVNPEHLTAGTQSSNIREAFAKGRMVSPHLKKRRTPDE